MEKYSNEGTSILFTIIILVLILGSGFLIYNYVLSPGEEEEQLQTVNLYYYNSEKDKDESGNVLCSRQGLVAVQREIENDDIIEETIKLLLRGELSQQERAQGVSTEYPLLGFDLKESTLHDGILTLTFEDLNGQTVGGSCRVGVLWFQIEATAKQFDQVNEVRFLPEDIFQP